MFKAVESMGFLLGVWEQASAMPGANPAQYRRDHLGNIICFAHYADDSKGTGWRAEHGRDGHLPVSTFSRRNE